MKQQRRARHNPSATVTKINKQIAVELYLVTQNLDEINIETVQKIEALQQLRKSIRQRSTIRTVAGIILKTLFVSILAILPVITQAILAKT